MNKTDIAQETQSTSHSKKVIAVLLTVLVIISALFFGGLHWRQTLFNPLSDDATIESSVVHIAASLPGRLEKLHVKEGEKVTKGQPLFTLDTEFYALRLQQAQAELAFAEATLETKLRVVQAELHNANISDDQIERARVNLQLAQQSRKRMAALAPKGYVAQEQMDQANTLARDAEISLKQAIQQANAAQALVGKADAELALVEINRNSVAMAERNMRLTTVYAPNDGRIVGLTVGEGEQIIPDAALFTLVNTNDWHAAAMYRETKLSHIEAGMCATVFVLSQPEVKMKGHVESIGWGVSTTDMINLPRGMPYVQKSVNWVRVEQRFPVRIKLDQQPEHESLLRMGASATVIIHDGERCD